MLENIEEKEARFGRRLMWVFDILGKNVEVVGFTSMSLPTRPNAYCWAEAIRGEIDPKIGWGSKDVVGSKCVVVLKTA